MPTFNYSGYGHDGSRAEGQLVASSRKEAIRQLTQKRIQTTRIQESNTTPKIVVQTFSNGKEKSTKVTVGTNVGESVTGNALKLKTRLFKPRNTVVALGFLDKLLELHQNGMPIGDCLKLMRLRVRDPQLQAISDAIWHGLSEGQTLAGTLAAQGNLFSAATVKMIEAGERSGNLVPILTNLVEHLHEQEALRKKLLGGLAYPTLVCCLTFIVAAGFLFGLLPKIKGMVESLGGEMNLLTRVLIFSGEVGIWLFPLATVLAVMGFASLLNWRKTDKGKYVTDGWILRLPLLGNIAHDNQLFQSTHLLSTLLQSGITLTDSMQLTEQTIENRHLKDRFHNSKIAINEGTSVSNAFRDTGFLTDLSLDILTIGESVGRVEHSLVSIQKRFRSSLNEQLGRLTVVITTTALTVAFTLVGLTAIGMVMSIFQVSQSLQLK